ncbi:hypothetical protein E3P96_03962 [Wallemia ichthyophaga]|nr:hypothetical protein E3P96_03962 [Wallemia ichthyophaga]
MKLTALLSIAAIGATASAHLLHRQDSLGESSEQCLQNECSSLYSAVRNDCYSDSDSIDNMSNKQKHQLYGCFCDAFRSASDDCKTCASNAGLDFSSLTNEYCSEASDNSSPITSLKTIA